MEFTLLAAALASAAGVLGGLWLQHRDDPGARRGLWDTALAAMLAGLVVGRLGAMVLAGTNPITHPADVLIVRSGVDTGWASFAALATVAVARRRNPIGALDGLAVAGLAGLSAWHGSCLLRGTCLGTPSDLPWAMAASGSGVTRHPVEIYAALALAAGMAIVAVWARRTARAGLPAGAALMVAAAIRLGTEPMRPGLGSGPEAWYAAGILAGILLVAAGRWAPPPNQE